MRIVSLLASATEIICALEAGDLLVGRSHECDNPPWVSGLPACSEPAFDISGSSAEIHREVTRRLRSGAPLYHIHTDRIRELAPDLIVAQSHCEVCAVTPGDVGRNGACIPDARIIGLNAGSVSEIFQSILEIARAINEEKFGHELVAREQARLNSLRAITASFSRRSVAVLEWTDPIFPMGNWGPELVEAANGILALGNANQHSHPVTFDDLLTADPEYLIVAPCGFDLKRSSEERPVLERYSAWHKLRAVREGKVAFADGNWFFNRSGMTIVRTAEILAEILYGIVIDEPTQGRHWVWNSSEPAI